MKKVIIDGVEYIPVTPEVKEEKRLEGWVDKKHFINSECTWINSTRVKTAEQTTKFVQIKENEIIVSEDDVRKAYNQYYYELPIANFKRFLDLLGFKKDGV